jgi:hypothetical protein
MQVVELHYLTETQLDLDAVVARAFEILKSDIETTEHGKPEICTLLHANQQHPAQTTIINTPTRTAFCDYESEIAQSWNCDDASDLIAKSDSYLSVREFLCVGVSPPDRLRLFHGVLQAMIEKSDPAPIALVFKHAMQVIAPNVYMDSCNSSPFVRPGSINLRYYQKDTGETLMDTLGMEDVGLIDLQCFYTKLDPEKVRDFIFKLAADSYYGRAVIEDGQAIRGICGGDWHCISKESMMDPKRTLMDIQPPASSSKLTVADKIRRLFT